MVPTRGQDGGTYAGSAQSAKRQAASLHAALQEASALELRDKGKIDESRKILVGNADFLNSSAVKYNSPRLKKYAEEQKDDYSNLDEANWSRQRKSMRAGQYKNKMR